MGKTVTFGTLMIRRTAATAIPERASKTYEKNTRNDMGI